MDEQRISVEARRVKLTLSNGSQLTGETFLQLHGKHLTGIQRIGEILNGEDNFLPLRYGGKVELINLEQVISISAAAEEEFDPLLALGEEHQIWVEPTVGEALNARIFVNLSGDRNRVKDFLNQKKRFLLLLQEDQVVYLARNKILRVQD
ncbi:MAG: hypothetical protein PF441_08700 [Desulfuromusa sp.]|jgi:hypothetical protein|nr:hypothetical protein [Desulfuromusa sp.]